MLFLSSHHNFSECYLKFFVKSAYSSQIAVIVSTDTVCYVAMFVYTDTGGLILRIADLKALAFFKLSWI